MVKMTKAGKIMLAISGLTELIQLFSLALAYGNWIMTNLSAALLYRYGNASGRAETEFMRSRFHINGVAREDLETFLDRRTELSDNAKKRAHRSAPLLKNAYLKHASLYRWAFSPCCRQSPPSEYLIRSKFYNITLGKGKQNDLSFGT